MHLKIDNMSVEYTNFKGEKYYLHEGKTKKGNPRYWFSKSNDGTLPKAVPGGYEIYEEPNGMVFLRKIQPQVITDDEINIVNSSIPGKLDTKVVVQKNMITVYLSEGIFPMYMAMMRFILVDQKYREYKAQRYCFKGSIDDWIELDRSDDLQKLANRYCYHLGKESFYDLM